MSKKRLLINFVYYRPVGHLVEALKYAKGYYNANKDIDICLLLNSRSPIELAEVCYWIKKIYPIKISEKFDVRQLKGVPKIWDYIISDLRTNGMRKGWDEDDLMKTQKILQKYFQANIASGYTHPHSGFKDIAKIEQVLPYKLNAKIILPIPEKAINYTKKYNHRGPKICIMLGGSAGNKQSPSMRMWLKICQALDKSIPNLKIYFTGITKSAQGRTATVGFALKEVNGLVKKLSNAESCFNIGLWNQLALIKKCNIFLSPHTGFGFLPPMIGTPWLAISNCPWQEYFFNDVKFYSVLPDCGHYPSQRETKVGCGKLLAEDKKCLCMTDKLLEEKIPEIIRGTKLLLDKDFTYKKAIDLHFKKIKNHPKMNLKDFFFFDGVEGVRSDKP